MKLFISIIYIIFTTTLLQADIDNEYQSKELYIKYTKYPTNVYTNQRFSVELEARVLIPKNKYDSITTTFSDEENIEVLDGDIIWEEKENNLYTTKITYKIEDKKFKLPILKLSLMNYIQEIDYIKIKPPKIKYNKIAVEQEKFSNIIADDLQIKSIKTKQYNNKMLMVICNMESLNGNLDKFYLKQFQEQGIKDFSETNAKQSMYYYMIIPSHISSIKFDYYNPLSSKFITVELPIMLEDELISTQTNLNPNEGSLLFYKQVSSLGLLVVFILIYLKTKDKIFILPIILFGFLFIKLVLPNQKIIINKDTKVYILPTKSSTVYKIVDKRSEVEVLQKKKGFIKILFTNKNIGWIRESDVK